MQNNQNINNLLQERAKTHGDFKAQSKLTQLIKELFRQSQNWSMINSEQRESLDMSAGKIARILCGNPNEPDHWQDIAGYSMLVANSLQKTAP